MELCGRLISVSAHGEWARGTLEVAHGDRVAVIGRGLAGLEQAECYRLSGQYVDHPKYGKQFDVVDALVDAPSEGMGVLKFLQKHFKGCGGKTAAAILDWYSAEGGGLEGLRSDLVNRPWQVEKCPGLGARKIEYMDASGAGLEVHVTRRLAAGLAGAQVPERVIKQIAQWLLKSGGQHSGTPVKACWTSMKEDPFMPVLHVNGVRDANGRESGFDTGDWTRPSHTRGMPLVLRGERMLETARSYVPIDGAGKACTNGRRVQRECGSVRVTCSETRIPT